MSQIATQKKAYWECPNCQSRYFQKPSPNVSLRNGRLTIIGIHPVCPNCFDKCRGGHDFGPGERCKVCGDPRRHFNLIRHILEPDDPNFGITTTGSTSYPSIVGKTAVGASQDSGDVGYNIADKFTPAATITVSAIMLYTSQTTGHVMAAIYSDNSGKPGAKLVASASIAVSAAGWICCPITPTSLTGGVQIWLNWQSDASGNMTKYDVGSAGDEAHCNTGSYGTWMPDNSASWVLAALNYSVYAVGTIGLTKGIRVQFPAAGGTVTDFYFYTHVGAAGDHFTLSLYDDSGGYPNHRLWYSASTGSASTTWNHLTLAQGTLDNSWSGSLLQNAYYWFMWQWDSGDSGPSYALGSANTGIFKAQAYGTLDSTWSGGTLSTENWSAYLTYSSSISVSASDAGSGADVLQQGNQASDVGSGIEGLTSSVTFGISDSGSGSDSPREEMDYLDNAIGSESPIIPTLQIADAGVGIDTETSSVTFSVGDAGAGADNPLEYMYYNDKSNRINVGVAVNPFDVGAGVDLIAIGIGGSDVGMGTDAATPQITVTDAGTGVEIQGLQLTISDAGSGSDVQVLQATFGVSDLGTGGDVTTFDSSFSTADSGFGSDSGAFDGTLTLADVGSGNENQSLSASFTITDAGSGLETSTEELDGSDVGSGSDTSTLQASFTMNDAGSGTETSILQVTFAVGDAGAGADNPQEWLYLNDQSNRIHIPGNVFANDYGAAADLVALQVTFQVADVGSGVEVPTFNVTFNTADSGFGSEATTFQVSLTVNDVALGSELFGKAFTTFDSGLGSDAYARYFFPSFGDVGSGSERFAIRVLRKGRLQYIVRLSVTENVFDTSAFDPYAYE